MGQHEMIAMLLAGGKGTRLEALTKKVAKPAVFFGGKYRIIDFPLSNCANSNVNVIGVLTQYESIQLNAYIGSGAYWGFDGIDSRAIILAPRQKESGATWYQGTANAIYHNLDFIDLYDPKYVLILSGDHIYKMNYDKMLRFHKENNADLTIAVLTVPWEETSRFGIMTTDETQRIVEFDEKPKNAKSNLASMGIYIFSYDVLKRYLEADQKNVRDEYDFGKHIIPALIKDKMKVMAYQFKGYWKDVGTIQSLWEANMDLLTDTELDLYNRKTNWKIYSEDTHSSPQFIGPNGSVSNSMINQGCKIDGSVQHSVLFHDVTVEEGAVVTDCVLLPGSHIGKNTKIHRVIVNEHNRVKDNQEINLGQNEIKLIAD